MQSVIQSPRPVRQARRNRVFAPMGTLPRRFVHVTANGGVRVLAALLHLMVALLRLHHGRVFVLGKSFCFVAVGALHLKGRFVQQRAVVLGKHTPRHVVALDIAPPAVILGATFASDLSMDGYEPRICLNCWGTAASTYLHADSKCKQACHNIRSPWYTRDIWESCTITQASYINLALEHCEPNPASYKEWCDSMPAAVREKFIKIIVNRAEWEDGKYFPIYVYSALTTTHGMSKATQPDWSTRAQAMLGY